MSSDSPRNGTDPTISKSELLAELRRLADELDTSPSVDQMDEHGAYSSRTYRKRFDSWNEAKAEAGIEPTRTVRYSKAELLDRLCAFGDEIDATPSKAQMREHGPHAPSTYASRFGSWTAALEAAGFEPETAATGISVEDLLADLRRVADRLDRRPTSEEYDEHGRFSDSTYFRRFDSWDDALERAGVADRYESAPSTQHATAELLEELSRLGEVLGRAPTHTEMERLGEYSPGTYRRRFGSWRDALAEAGFDPDAGERATAKRRISEELLLAEIRRLADENGRPPTYQEVESDGRYAGATYLDRFGTWNDALEAAGYDRRTSRREKIPTRELVRELRALAAEVGSRPYRKTMDDRGPYSGMTYYNRFGSWQSALDAAGLVADDGVAVLVARCDACATRLRESVADVSAADGVFCDSTCHTGWRQPVVRVDADVFDGTDPDALDRLAAALRDDVLVSEVLYALDHALSFFESGFEAAEFPDHRIAADGDAVAITRFGETPPEEIRFERSTLRALADRIEAAPESESHDATPADPTLGQSESA
ncbi:homing endonuclease associated repeat-containing protein [Halorussus marinus]|uniref:homing endonuclease associated repeat-containing protein n=1 Tax=Halorussus marinus TaxID=2505976 RepID=UPI00106E02BD|nr:hypothetical protein [Halorussus marinus]